LKVNLSTAREYIQSKDKLAAMEEKLRTDSVEFAKYNPNELNDKLDRLMVSDILH
jgi:hypothetical protein